MLSGGWIFPDGAGRASDASAFWRAGVVRPIAVQSGRAIFRVATSGPRSETLVVVSALSRSPGPYPIRLTARPATRSEVPRLADDGPAQHAAHPDPARHETSPGREPGAAGLPPAERTFHMMHREGDPDWRGNYVAIRGVLRGVGHRVQVYVADEDVARVGRAVLAETITTLDDRVIPAARRRFGLPRDVDHDGRFTVLFSSRLDRLGGGRHAVDGFVRVADLDCDVPAPFGNRCDMMYLSASLTQGPYLRTVLAHEYTHAIVFTRKVLDQSVGGVPASEEEGWLDEALAHLEEDFHGFSTENIDYRVSTFLSSPERHRLVVDDYYRADLFRSHGTRGSTYLFLRWCVDRYGPQLVSTLVRSRQRGVANLEEATGLRFAALYRRWSLALFQGGLEPEQTAAPGTAIAERPTSTDDPGFHSIHLRAPMGDRELAGPRYARVAPGGPPERWNAESTTSHFAIVEGGTSGAVEIEVEGPPDAELQVSALPLGDDLPRVSLAAETAIGPDGTVALRARVLEGNGRPVRLSALAWEPLVPAPRPRVDGPPAGRLDMLGVAAAFGTSALGASGELSSRPIPLPGIKAGCGPIVLKVIGTDERGRRVAAWAEVDPTAGPGPEYATTRAF